MLAKHYFHGFSALFTVVLMCRVRRDVSLKISNPVCFVVRHGSCHDYIPELGEEYNIHGSTILVWFFLVAQPSWEAVEFKSFLTWFQFTTDLFVCVV